MQVQHVFPSSPVSEGRYIAPAPNQVGSGVVPRSGGIELLRVTTSGEGCRGYPAPPPSSGSGVRQCAVLKRHSIAENNSPEHEPMPTHNGDRLEMVQMFGVSNMNIRNT